MPTPSLVAEYDRLYAAALVQATHKLVNADTGEEVTLPAYLTAWDRTQHWVESFRTSRFEGNEGYVHTRMHEVLVPSVFGLKIVAAQ